MDKPIKQSVEDWVAQVDYTINPDYIPSEFALAFVNFIKLVNGSKGEEHLTPVLHYSILDLITGKKKKIANMLFRGSAKALSLDTEILTPYGHIPMRDIQIGDTVIDRRGEPTKVTHVSSIFTNKTYEIKLTDGSSFIANEDHQHITQRRSTRGLGSKGQKQNSWKEEVLTTKELFEKGVVYKREITKRTPKGRDIKWYIPLVNSPVKFDSVGSPLDPYTVGLILGDGSICKNTGIPGLSSHIDDVEEIRSYIPYDLGEVYHDKRRYETTSFRIKGIGPLVKQFIGTNSTWTKNIPKELLYGSIEDRVRVLQGLMDTDGTISPKGYATFTSASEQLAKGVNHIVKSLGGYSSIKRHENAYSGYYFVTVCLQDINPFRLKRKADRWRSDFHLLSGTRIGIESIEPTKEPVPSKCISVDSPTESYLIENSIITHNTTLTAEYLFLYLALYGEIPGFGKVPLAIYLSDSIDNGVKNLRKNLQYRWENSEFLQQYIPTIKFTDTRWEFINIDKDNFVVKAYGAKTGVRGTKEKGQRPVLAVLDDLVSDEDARSDTVIASIEDTVYKAVNFALHPSRSKIIWNGTPFNSRDPLYKAIESGAWHSNVFPMCEEFPCSKEEYKSAWPDRFPYEYAQEQYDAFVLLGKIANFNQELMLRIMSDEERLILDSDILWYKYASVREHKGRFNFYITTDFATTAKTSADFSVISVWALNHNGDWFWVDGIVKKQTMDLTVDDLFRLAQKWKPQSVGIEISGQQKGFINWIMSEMLNRNIYFSLASGGNNKEPGLPTNTNKVQKFSTVVPWFKAKKMYFPEEKKNDPELVEAITELSLAAIGKFKSKHDDFIDTISQLAELKTWRPSEETNMHKTEDDIWEEDEEETRTGMAAYIV